MSEYTSFDSTNPNLEVNISGNSNEKGSSGVVWWVLGIATTFLIAYGIGVWSSNRRNLRSKLKKEE